MDIQYLVNREISADEFIALLNRSTLGERRPVDDLECVRGMLEHADLTLTAWDGERLVGVACSVTAVAILQLQEEGKLDLKRPVDEYLQFPLRNPRHPEAVISVEQVLLHTSSISNGPSLWRNYRCGDHPVTLEEWARGYFLPDGDYWHPDGNFERWGPGEGFQYSNAGYGLLAHLVEVASGRRFQSHCKERIFVPLDMPNSSFTIADLDTGRMATIYAWGELWDLERDLARPALDLSDTTDTDRYVPLCHYSDPTLGAGGLFTNADDLSHFLIMLMNGGIYKGRRILSEESVGMMFSPGVDRSLLPPWFVDLGMGAYAMKLDNGEPVWGNTGADAGISTYMMFNREIDLGAIVLANRFFDIRDLIPWLFAEGAKNYVEREVLSRKASWQQYSEYDGDLKRTLHTITVRVWPEMLPAGSELYINGNHRYLGAWIGSGIPLDEAGDGSWERSFSFPDSTELSFKITRGSWQKQAVHGDGTVPDPHSLIVCGATTLLINVENWQDAFGK